MSPRAGPFFRSSLNRAREIHNDPGRGEQPGGPATRPARAKTKGQLFGLSPL
jgi:hypothetical protein